MLKATEQYAKELSVLFSKNSFVVFLCGPKLDEVAKPGSKLRKIIKDLLEKEGFDVVLGEDEGLEEPRLKFGAYAHDNELRFLQNHCNAIVLIADSVGSFCELGLFAYKKTLKDGQIPDFILIVKKEHEDQKSYFNEGPAKAVKHHGVVFYTDFEKFDPSEILERLKGLRSVYFMDMTGRPPGRVK